MATMLERYRSFDRDAIAAEVRGRYSPVAVADRWEAVYAEALTAPSPARVVRRPLR